MATAVFLAFKTPKTLFFFFSYFYLSHFNPIQPANANSGAQTMLSSLSFQTQCLLIQQFDLVVFQMQFFFSS